MVIGPLHDFVALLTVVVLKSFSRHAGLDQNDLLPAEVKLRRVAFVSLLPRGSHGLQSLYARVGPAGVHGIQEVGDPLPLRWVGDRCDATLNRLAYIGIELEVRHFPDHINPSESCLQRTDAEQPLQPQRKATSFTDGRGGDPKTERVCRYEQNYWGGPAGRPKLGCLMPISIYASLSASVSSVG